MDLTHGASAEALQLALSQTAEGDGLSPVAEHFRGEIRAFLQAHGPVALTRACEPGHLTASCLLWDDACERILLHHHRKLDLWLQFGGHCDGDGDVRRSRSARPGRSRGSSRGGCPRARGLRHPLDPGAARQGARPPEPEHLHLDVRFTAVAPPGAMERLSDESLALAWLLPEEARARGLDDSLLRIIDLGPPATD